MAPIDESLFTGGDLSALASGPDIPLAPPAAHSELLAAGPFSLDAAIRNLNALEGAGESGSGAPRLAEDELDALEAQQSGGGGLDALVRILKSNPGLRITLSHDGGCDCDC